MQSHIETLLKKGVLLSPDVLSCSTEEIQGALSNIGQDAPLVFGKGHLAGRPETENGRQDVEVLESYTETNAKITIKDFVKLYNDRYHTLHSLLRQRQELSSATTIRKALFGQEGEQAAIIGLVLETSITKNNNLMLTLEDPTGTIKAVINKNNKETAQVGKEITQDEVIGLQGTLGNKIIFANSIIFPDIPLTKELKKSPSEEAAVFISDLHIGSKAFLSRPLEKLAEWMNQNTGTEEQKALVKKLKYLFIVGDIVDGIGIYPDQEKDLEIKDIFEQYNYFSSFLKKIPPHINIIICPGNHDQQRIAEPQPALSWSLLQGLENRKNIFLVSSPSIVRVGETKNFPGFDFLIYHGYSFPYYADAIEPIRAKGGLENTENIMMFLLKKRHLAPTHGSTQYQLGYAKDPLVIRSVPDFFISGHIHRASVKNYRNVTLINSSCWIAQTEYQEKVGLIPQPARAIYVDLKTRESKILNFSEK